MKPTFTPAAERAILSATQWRQFATCHEAGLPELLLGLLSETECRASHLLLTQGIDELAIRQKWPELQRGDHKQDFSTAVRWFCEPIRQAYDKVRTTLWDCTPIELATEHLLWGIVSSGSPVAAWLADHGLSEYVLETDVMQRSGRSQRDSNSSLDVQACLDAPTNGRAGQDVGVPTLVTEPISSDSSPYADLHPASPPSEILPRSLETKVVRQAEADTLLSKIRAVAPAAKPPGPAGVVSPSDHQAVLRALDASANRAREAGRVVEDYVRFVLNDRFLTEQLKSLRHEMVSVFEMLPSGDRMHARDSNGDVGTMGLHQVPAPRSEVGDVAAANFARLTEALRSLEEFGKIYDGRIAERIEPLRYKTYTLERAVRTTMTAASRFAAAQLYVLVDGAGTTDRFVQLMRQLVMARVDVLQLRDKRLSDRDLLARAKLLRELTRDTETLFIVNDRPDVAVLVDADGVHVGQDEFGVQDVRRVIGPGKIVGVSTHHLDQAQRAVLDGADYIGVGPTFPSQTKSFRNFPGLDYLRAVHREIRLPAFAIGGITPQNLSQVLQTGASRVAIGASISNSSQPAAAVREFRKLMGRAEGSEPAPAVGPILITTSEEPGGGNSGSRTITD